MLRPAHLGCLLAAATLAAGCGGRGDDGPVSDEQAVRLTLEGYASAFAKRDYAALCEVYLDRELVRGLERAGVSCEGALKPEISTLREPAIEIRDVRVDGEQATADVRTTAANQPPADATLALKRSDGRWQIVSTVEIGPQPGAP